VPDCGQLTSTTVMVMRIPRRERNALHVAGFRVAPPAASWSMVQPLLSCQIRHSFTIWSVLIRAWCAAAQVAALEQEAAELRAAARRVAPLRLPAAADVLASLGLDKWQDARLAPKVRARQQEQVFAPYTLWVCWSWVAKCRSPLSLGLNNWQYAPPR